MKKTRIWNYGELRNKRDLAPEGPDAESAGKERYAQYRSEKPKLKAQAKCSR